MSRSRPFLFGLVVGILAGGIVGGGLAVLVGGAQPDAWLPQGVAIGTSVAAGIGYLTAWLVIGRTRPVPPASPIPESALAARIQATAIEPTDPDREPDSEPAPAAATGSGPRNPARTEGPLPVEAIQLAGRATGRMEAIEEAGALLVASGAVEPAYVAAMQVRERTVSTHMGGALAVPHGSRDTRQLVRHSALALVRYPDTIDWYGNRVRFVVAIAAVDEADQVRLVSRVAEVFLDEETVARLEETADVAEVADAFS